MEEDKFKSSKSDGILEKQDDLLLALCRWIFILVIVFILSILVWKITMFLLLPHFGIFLQVFIDFYTKHILQYLWFTLQLLAAACAGTGVLEACRLLISKRHEKKDEKSQKWHLLSFYITCLLSMPLMIHLLFWILRPPEFDAFSVKLEIIYALSILIFFVFTLLKLCLKHPVSDRLFLIWSVIALLAVFHLKPIFGIIVMTFILIMLIASFKLDSQVKKEINLNAIIKVIKKLKKELTKLLLKTNLFYNSEFQMANKIYLLLILTLALFTIGTIFIADFTHAGEYSIISRNIELCVYGHPCVPYHNNISSICSLHHKNIKDNLTFIKTKRGNYSALYSVDTFCTQYDQHRKDFITYFSALIVATITFFVMMYEKFIRRKEDTKN